MYGPLSLSGNDVGKITSFVRGLAAITRLMVSGMKANQTNEKKAPPLAEKLNQSSKLHGPR